MEKEQKALLDAMDIMIENKLKEKLKFNYYVDGVIQTVNADNTYNVLINGGTHNNIPTKNGFSYKVGDIVQVLIKNGDWSKKFIDDKKSHNELPNDVKQLSKLGVAEQGTSGIWNYRKWNDGTAECWGTYKAQVDSIDETWGTTNNPSGTWCGLYVKSVNERIDYPFTFIERPNEQVKMCACSISQDDIYSPALFLYAESLDRGMNTSNQTATYCCARTSEVTKPFYIILDFYIIGRWK